MFSTDKEGAWLIETICPFIGYQLEKPDKKEDSDLLLWGIH